LEKEYYQKEMAFRKLITLVSGTQFTDKEGSR
jgi:hypothetical protein